MPSQLKRVIVYSTRGIANICSTLCLYVLRIVHTFFHLLLHRIFLGYIPVSIFSSCVDVCLQPSDPTLPLYVSTTTKYVKEGESMQSDEQFLHNFIIAEFLEMELGFLKRQLLHRDRGFWESFRSKRKSVVDRNQWVVSELGR